MTRFGFAALAAACASILVVSACASADAEPAAPIADGSIALRARIDHGAWQHRLSLKLVKTKLITFSLCAVWSAPSGSEFRCEGPHGAQLPRATTMRLEQHPVGQALKRADSPGWGMLATSSTARVAAALSNTVTGDVIGRFRYRVTLRDPAGKVLLRSNVFSIDWHR